MSKATVGAVVAEAVGVAVADVVVAVVAVAVVAEAGSQEGIASPPTQHQETPQTVKIPRQVINVNAP